MSSFEFLFLGWLFASQKSGFSGFQRKSAPIPSRTEAKLHPASELASPALTILATVFNQILEIEPISSNSYRRFFGGARAVTSFSTEILAMSKKHCDNL